MKKLIIVGLLLLSNPLNCCPSCAGSSEDYTPAFFSDDYYQAYERSRRKPGKDSLKDDAYENDYIDNTNDTIIIDN